MQRLTPAPGALSPVARGDVAESKLGSQFSRLLEEVSENGSDREAEDLAIWVATKVLLEERLVSQDVACQPTKSDDQLAQDF